MLVTFWMNSRFLKKKGSVCNRTPDLMFQCAKRAREERIKVIVLRGQVVRCSSTTGDGGFSSDTTSYWCAGTNTNIEWLDSLLSIVPDAWRVTSYSDGDRKSRGQLTLDYLR